MDDDEATKYLEDLIEERHEIMTEWVISDTNLTAEKDVKETIFSKLENEIFHKGEYLGAGQTAQVRGFEFETREGKKIPMAIKYLLTPTEKTLSASAEHDMLSEVERIETIERIEKVRDFKFIKVPHPYFHFKNEKVQCYGMERVDGLTFQEFFEGGGNLELYKILQEKFSQIKLEDLFDEVEAFFTNMHTYCLHGDIKPGNMMIDQEGKIYLIDFGQSLLATDVTEAAMEQFYNLKMMEVENIKATLRKFYRMLEE